MSTTAGYARADFWSTIPISNLQGAPYRLNCWMSQHRFNSILKALQYTDSPPPEYIDKFWEVRQMIFYWKGNMARNFSPSSIVCLDESMSIWNSRWTCPGWMFVPRKPHPFGNEYHTISCGESGILFDMELVEGKDQPPETRTRPGPLGKNW